MGIEQLKIGIVTVNEEDTRVTFYPGRTLWDYSFAIPNGLRIAGNAAARGRRMARAKREGLRPGVSDLFIGYPMGRYHGLFLELKAAKGVTSDDQGDFLSMMRETGYCCLVVKGYKQAVEIIEAYMQAVL